MTVKLFLGGVSPNTSSEVITNHFQKFGHVVDAIVMRDRGFGFVTFESQEAADNALAQPHQNIEGQMVDVKTAVGKGGGKGGDRGGGGGGGRGSPGGTGITDKIFVGGLPQDCADDKIKGYFEQYGIIVDAVVMKDRDTGRSRGFGFIQYDNPDPVEKVMAEYSSHKIEGKWVEVKRSIPKDQMPAPPPRDSRDRGDRGDRGDSRDRGGSCGGSMGYGGGGCGYSAPPRGYEMPPAGYGGAYVGGPSPYGGAYGAAYGGAYGAAYGGYPGYPGYGAGYGMPPPAGYGGYGMDPYAAAYAGYSAPPGGQAPPGGKGRSAPY